MEANTTSVACDVALFIDRPPEAIWSFLLDLTNDTKWRTGVKAAWLTAAPPVGLGTTGVHLAAVLGAFPWIITAWEDQRVAGWDFTSGLLTGTHGRYRVEPERDGSRVSIQATFRVAGLFGVLMPLMRPIIPRRLAGDLRKLKAIMEA